MLRKIILAIFVFVIFSAVNSFADESQYSCKITLEQAIDLALKNNIDFKSTQLDLEIQKNRMKIANRLQNPNVSTFYNYGKAGRGNPQQIGVSQLIEVGKRDVRKQLAKTNMALAQESYEFAAFNLKMNVRKAYVELVAAKSVLDIVQSQKVLIEDLLKIAKKKRLEGKAPDMDVLQAEITLAQLSTEVNTARSNVQTAKFRFNKVLNIKGAEEFHEAVDGYLPKSTDFIMLLTPKPKEEIPEFVQIADILSNNRFDLKIAKKEIDVAKCNLTAVQKQRIPDLEVAGGYAYQPSGHTDGQGHLNGAYAGMSLVNIPVLYNYSPEIKNAKIELEQAMLNYDSVKDAALYDLNTAYEKFVTAKINLNYYDDKMIAKSDELMRISKKNYEMGKSDLTTLIVMEKSYQSIKTGYIVALSLYYTSWIEFLKEVNDEAFSLKTETL